jgi:1,3-beta-glucan synthase
MSGHPQGGHYDNGYGHQEGNTDSYYQDDHNQGYYDNGGYMDQNQHGHHQGADGYYDESCASPSEPNCK